MIKATMEKAIFESEQTGVWTIVNPDQFELSGWEEELGTDGVCMWTGGVCVWMEWQQYSVVAGIVIFKIIFRFIYFTLKCFACMYHMCSQYLQKSEGIEFH